MLIHGSRETGPDLENYGSVQYLPKSALYLKKGHQNFTTPCLIDFLSVLHQNKALYNFQEMVQHLIARLTKGLD